MIGLSEINHLIILFLSLENFRKSPYLNMPTDVVLRECYVGPRKHQSKTR